MNAKRLAPLCAVVLLLLFCAAETRAQPTCFVTRVLSADCPDTSGDLVFVGRVVSLKTTDEKTGVETETDALNGYPRGRAVIAVEELFKGEAGAVVELPIRGGCYGRISKDKRYVFNLPRELDGSRTYHWSGELDDLPEDEAAQLFEAIRANLRGERQPRLYGVLRHADRHGFIAGITVVADRDGVKFESLTDAVGRYEFRELPEGEYEVYPLLPPSLSPPDDPRDGQPRERHDNSVRIYRDTACGTRQDFTAQDTGSISGRVVDADGKPFVLAGVSLRSFLDRSGFASLISAKERLTHKREGNFSFVNLPPGRYLVEITVPGDERGTPTFYYPGVVYQKDARVINLAAGAKVTDIVIKIPRAKQK